MKRVEVKKLNKGGTRKEWKNRILSKDKRHMRRSERSRIKKMKSRKRR